MGFITNERECMVMANPTHQDSIAQSIADGVKAYFARSGLSYSGSGSSEAPSGGNDTPDVPDTPDTPDTPDVPDTPDQPTTDEPEPTVPTEDPAEPETTEPVTPTTDEPDKPVTVEPGGGGGIRVE